MQATTCIIIINSSIIIIFIFTIIIIIIKTQQTRLVKKSIFKRQLTHAHTNARTHARRLKR
ncbi:hypothetical protein E2C01_097492 [Portunus trituberculatus]|uniref:Uncharacterized protein n=1 Tax=Portunus trituberculatus TaxID=210409 RepID=A0A5B7JYM3_PORTR|nr:hypothetical protein [Portunus trituberculatus]